MTIDHVECSEDLSLLVKELGEHSDEESLGVVEESLGWPIPSFCSCSYC